MAPLEGEGISEAAVSSLLETLAADCTCIQTPSRLGVDILMPWDQAADEALVRAAPISQPVDTLTAVMSAKASAVADASPPASIATTRSATIVLWMVGGLILFSAAGSVVILWQRQARSPDAPCSPDAPRHGFGPAEHRSHPQHAGHGVPRLQLVLLTLRVVLTLRGTDSAQQNAAAIRSTRVTECPDYSSYS